MKNNNWWGYKEPENSIWRVFYQACICSENIGDPLADAKATLRVLQKQLEIHNELIPDEIEELDQFCQGDKKRVDFAGKLYEKEEEVYWNFGKHKGKLVKETLDYAEWAIGRDFPENTKKHLNLIIESNNINRK